MIPDSPSAEHRYPQDVIFPPHKAMRVSSLEVLSFEQRQHSDDDDLVPSVEATLFEQRRRSYGHAPPAHAPPAPVKDTLLDEALPLGHRQEVETQYSPFKKVVAQILSEFTHRLAVAHEQELAHALFQVQGRMQQIIHDKDNLQVEVRRLRQVIHENDNLQPEVQHISSEDKRELSKGSKGSGTPKNSPRTHRPPLLTPRTSRDSTELNSLQEAPRSPRGSSRFSFNVLATPKLSFTGLAFWRRQSKESSTAKQEQWVTPVPKDKATHEQNPLPNKIQQRIDAARRANAPAERSSEETCLISAPEFPSSVPLPTENPLDMDFQDPDIAIRDEGKCDHNKYIEKHDCDIERLESPPEIPTSNLEEGDGNQSFSIGGNEEDDGIDGNSDPADLQKNLSSSSGPILLPAIQPQSTILKTPGAETFAAKAAKRASVSLPQAQSALKSGLPSGECPQPRSAPKCNKFSILSSASAVEQPVKKMRFQDEDEERGNFALHLDWKKDDDTHDLKRASSSKSIMSKVSQAGRLKNVGFDDSSSDEENKLDGRRATVLRRFSRLVLRPSNKYLSLWRVLGCVFILYDCIVLPMDLMRVHSFSVNWLLEWFSRVYWTLDIPIASMTGYVELNGRTQLRVTKVVRRYLRHWFCLDAFLLLCDYTAAIFREVQVVKMMRLVRIVKYQGVPDFISNEVGLILFGFSKIIFFVVWFNHFVACTWYAISTSQSTTHSEYAGGWLARYQEVYGSIDPDSRFFIYLIAYRWSLSNFVGESNVTPTTNFEYVYLLGTMFISFVATAGVVSSITTSMTRLQIAAAHDSKRFSLLKQYLLHNRITPKLGTRVTRNAQYQVAQEKKRTPEKSIELLSMISEPLRVDLSFEINMKLLESHAFFRIYAVVNEGLMKKICHTAMGRVQMARSDVLFRDGEAALVQHMYFVIDGRLKYARFNTISSTPPKTIKLGQWACEPVLWTNWQHYGTLRAADECSLAVLGAETFRQIVKGDIEFLDFVIKYASNFVKDLNQTSLKSLTDLHDQEIDLEWHLQKALPEDMDEDFRKHIMSLLHGKKTKRGSQRTGSVIMRKLHRFSSKAPGSGRSSNCSRGSLASNCSRDSRASEASTCSEVDEKLKITTDMADASVPSRQTRMPGFANERRGSDASCRSWVSSSIDSNSSGEADDEEDTASSRFNNVVA